MRDRSPAAASRPAAAINAALFLDLLAAALPVWLYAAGAVMLLAKLSGRLEDLPAAVWLGGLSTAALPFGYAAFRLRRAGFPPEYALAWLDLRNHAGGRILAGAPDARAAAAVTPAWSLGPLARRQLWPALFVLAVAIAPAPEDAAGRRASGAAVRRRIAALERAVDAADLEKALPSPAAGELRDRLRDLARLAAAQPEMAAENLDAVRESLESALLMRIDLGLKSAEKAAAARQSPAEGKIPAEAGALPAGARPELADMFAALHEMARFEGGLPNLPPRLRAAVESALADTGAADLANLRENMEALAKIAPADLDALLGALREANTGNLARADAALAANLAGTGLDTALKALIQERHGRFANQRGGAGAALPGGADGSGDGSGGAGEGGGPAPLAFGSESDDSGARFAPRALPPGEKGFLPGVVMARAHGRLPDDAETEDAEAIRRTGARVAGSVRAGESAPPLSPARRRAAARYFERLAGD